MTSQSSTLTLASALEYVGACVATYSFHDEATGAYWRLNVDEDGDAFADKSVARVHTLDGAVWEVRLENGALAGLVTGEIIRDVQWDIGYQAGFADGANVAAGDE